MKEGQPSNGIISTKDRPASPGERVANLVNNSNRVVRTPVETEVARIVNQERYDPYGQIEETFPTSVNGSNATENGQDGVRVGGVIVEEKVESDRQKHVEDLTHMGD